MSSETDLEAVMRDFKRGFAKADRESFARAITDDFEWHMHWFDSGDEQPTGKVLVGLDAVMEEIARRQAGWSDLHYEDVEERYLDDMVVQTFVVSGIDDKGLRFHCAAVDLYPVRDGRIARKQTYWKQPG